MISDPNHHTERLDSLSRDICSRFANEDRVGVMVLLNQCRNHAEAALVAIWTAQRLTNERRTVFIDFLTYQAISFQT